MSLTIDQELRERGYTHRKAADCENTGKHDIFLGKEFVGSMTAHEACQFLEALREADNMDPEDIAAGADMYDRLKV